MLTVLFTSEMERSKGTRRLTSLFLPFEIVPLTDPTVAKPGALVPFKLLYEGVPLADITIHAHDGRKAATDEKGEFQLPVKQPGFYSLYAKKKIPVDNDPEMDYLQLMTFIAFTTK